MTDRRRTDDRPLSESAMIDQLWQSAEHLIQRIELSSEKCVARPDDSHRDFFVSLVGGLRHVAGADTVRLRVGDGLSWTTLADEGIVLASESSEPIVGKVSVGRNEQLELAARFTDAVTLPRRSAMEHLAKALVDIASTVYLSGEVNRLRSRLQQQDDRDEFLIGMYRGNSLRETFALIASSVSRNAVIDRVMLMSYQHGRFRLSASSTQAKIDRRAAQVRLLERLADHALRDSKIFSFAVGTERPQDTEFSPDMDRYLDESGSREIYVESIFGDDAKHPVAAIVLERFRIPENAPERLREAWLPIRKPVSDAICHAIERDESTVPIMIDRLTSLSTSRKAWAAAIAAVVLFVAAWIPVRFRLPVEGHVVAKTQSRVFAPANAVVSDVQVADGQAVRKGQTLMTLWSSELDLKQQVLTTERETARAKLDSVSVLRTGKRDSQSSADEQVLLAQIAGLQRQLELVESQQQRLTITSPIDGVIDQWNVSEILAARPVVPGQYLLTIVAPADGWKADLDIPDQSVAYVLDARSDGNVSCSLKLRSNPTDTFSGTIDQISGVADVHVSGQSMVRATAMIEDGSADLLRQGATVIAEIDCGRRTAGFVYFRGVIQWYRRQTWF